MPKRTAAALVEVRDPATNLNLFMDLREQVAAGEAKIETMKPLIAKLVAKGKTKNLLDGVRNGQKGKFSITIVPRDNRKPDNDKTIALLQRKGIHAVRVDGVSRPVLKTVVVFDPDALATLVQDGTLSREEINDILVGSVTSYPKVDFKPGQ